MPTADDDDSGDVFSAHAEVVPKLMLWIGRKSRILRTRGGSSFLNVVPHAAKRVFSAHAEVVLRYRKPTLNAPGILRTRGGSSEVEQSRYRRGRYSPRTRR